ncbi:hypothetical protein DAPPUDRAFT_277784 [Daphnia pulex]|uniref:Uncharacterized protein n=1 Tax=Daphnia pulex TaxID=6669 RepID=E9I6J3_DAPPU|nr:hypothetical protein DAPPUDRAFT_277784 [Daphnia pulex]|eukprot:EFX60387.1 hypothetical protein DAPPUDRAFT_277784 [Daphnia pulex]
MQPFWAKPGGRSTPSRPCRRCLTAVNNSSQSCTATPPRPRASITAPASLRGVACSSEAGAAASAGDCAGDCVWPALAGRKSAAMHDPARHKGRTLQSTPTLRGLQLRAGKLIRIICQIRGIAAAGRSFQAAAIEHGQLAAVVFDQAAALHGAGRLGHTDPAHPQHISEELMGDSQLRRARAVLAHQQPARQARADLMEAQTAGGIGQMGQTHIEIALQDRLQRLAARQLGHKHRCSTAPGLAVTLHQGAQGRPVDAQAQLNAQHALAANHAHRQARVLVDPSQHGNEGLRGEIDMAGVLAGLTQGLRQAQLHRFAEGQQIVARRRRQGGDQAILQRRLDGRG